MNTNSTFWIGHDHTICEDYAISGIHKDFAYAIVCDGCSASPEVDFGARVLAKAARENLLRVAAVNPNESTELFGKATIAVAASIFKMFPHLHPQALDATLLATYIHNKKVTACLYGDGVFIHKTKGVTKSVHIGLSSGAPDYLSYHLDDGRMKSYNAMEDNKKEIWTNYEGIIEGKPFTPFVYQCDADEGDVVAVITDGINSFRKSDNEPIDWKDLVNEFSGFKTTEGEFALRRISAFKRKCLKEGTTHSDDISISSIIV